jgi:hypothetical protein
MDRQTQMTEQQHQANGNSVYFRRRGNPSSCTRAGVRGTRERVVVAPSQIGDPHAIESAAEVDPEAAVPGALEADRVAAWSAEAGGYALYAGSNRCERDDGKIGRQPCSGMEERGAGMSAPGGKRGIETARGTTRLLGITCLDASLTRLRKSLR